MIAPSNGARYAPYATLAQAADARPAAALYRHRYRLFQQRYEEEPGYPGKYVNDGPVAVIDHLVAAQEMQGLISLKQLKVLYRFANLGRKPLSAGQKFLARPPGERSGAQVPPAGTARRGWRWYCLAAPTRRIARAAPRAFARFRRRSAAPTRRQQCGDAARCRGSHEALDLVAVGQVVARDDFRADRGRRAARRVGEEPRVAQRAVDVHHQPAYRGDHQRRAERGGELARERERPGVVAAVAVEQRLVTAEQRPAAGGDPVAAVLAGDQEGIARRSSAAIRAGRGTASPRRGSGTAPGTPPPDAPATVAFPRRPGCAGRAAPG